MTLGTFICDIRRFFIYNFLRGYIFNSLSKRKGKCNQCGKCCKDCFLLKDNLCLEWDNRPVVCHKDFPIDKFELKVYKLKDKCGYYWD